jgi:hypothetical protein
MHPQGLSQREADLRSRCRSSLVTPRTSLTGQHLLPGPAIFQTANYLGMGKDASLCLFKHKHSHSHEGKVSKHKPVEVSKYRAPPLHNLLSGARGLLKLSRINAIALRGLSKTVRAYCETAHNSIRPDRLPQSKA